MSLPDTINHPRAFENSPAADYDGVFDWGWTRGCLWNPSVTPTDWDGVIERNGYFIVFETKNPGAPIKDGQWYALKSAHALGVVTIMTIYGKAVPQDGFIWRPGALMTTPESGEAWAGIEQARRLVSEWSSAVNSLSRPDPVSRISLLTDKMAHALREMRKVPDDQDKYSQALANIMIRDLGPVERSFLFATACKACPDVVFEKMVFSQGGPPPMGDV